MAAYKMRRVKFDGSGNVRSAGKRTSLYVTDDNRMEEGGVYLLPHRGMEFYQVVEKYGGERHENPYDYRRRSAGGHSMGAALGMG